MTQAKHTPMVVKAAKVLCKRNAEQCNVDFGDSWYVYGNDYLADAQAALEAAFAPELLEALQLALQALEAIGDEMTVGERYTNAGQYLLDSLQPSRAAIAKATGGAA